MHARDMRSIQKLVGGGDDSIELARRPEALADSLGAPPLEGIDWLGCSPEAHPPLLYRTLVGLGEAFLFGLCDLKLTVEGREHLPSGGYIAFCALHRSWVDPLLLVRALPKEPRVWFMGSGPTAFDRPWKERLLRHTGGILPVWRGGTDVSVHVRSAQAVIDEGAVLALFAEGRIGGEPDRPAKMRPGAALLCLLTGAPLVPVAICGAEELYRGKRIIVRILEPTTPSDLLGPDWAGLERRAPRDQLRAAKAMTAAAAARLEPVLAADHPGTVDAPGSRRRWPWLSRMLR